MTKDYLFIMRTVEDSDGIPARSGIYVKRESKNYYYGIWSSPAGSYNVKVLKSNCIRLESARRLENKFNRDIKETIKKMLKTKKLK